MHPSTLRAVWLSAGLAVSLLAAPALASVESELAFHRGVVAYGEDRLDEARRHFEIVLAEDPEDTVALHYLGLIAQKRGDVARALELYDRAIALDPEDPDLQLDRGIALFDAGRLPEAREAFARAIELDPDSARAHLFAGIAAHRMGAYAEARPQLARAAALDPSLSAQSRYYAGLGEAFEGNLAAAESAFGDVVQQSPLSPLGQSAQELRSRVAPRPAERRWQLALTAGMEYDSNPLIIPDFGVDIPGADDDGRGVFRGRASYGIIQREDYSLAAGYDGYLSLHFDETEVDLQMHSVWTSGGYQAGPARLGLRFDYGFTMLDRTNPFRHLIRVTPSVVLRPRDWAMSHLYYQWQWADFRVGFMHGDPVLDRDGNRNLVGLSQFFFLPEPFTYVRLGVLGDFQRTEGTEWDYDGIEASMGSGYDFPYGFAFTWLYRFVYRDYHNPSDFALTDPTLRDDKVHILTVDLAKLITEHWEVSVGGAFTWNGSNVDFFDYDRQVAGGYVTYRF